MKLEFIGTGASNWPEEERKKPGYRRRSSLLVEKELLIDPGPHIFQFAEDFDREDCYGEVEHILLTHSHDDHLCPGNLKRLCAQKERHFWCERAAAGMVEQVPGLRLHVLTPFRTRRLRIPGDGLSGRDGCGYRVTALPANHGTENPREQTFHYIVEKGDSRIFYGCDGAWLLRDTWYYMRRLTFDLMILDGTLGDAYGDYRIFEHNSLRMAELLAETIRTSGILKPKGEIFISHLAYGLHGSQAETEDRLKKAGIRVAYDGQRCDTGAGNDLAAAAAHDGQRCDTAAK